ncbi:MAG: hypothetical protein IJ489_01165 [Clostridia bacterium]|nr:hypothetical protein [Clostridia bacterium]
MYHKYFLTKGIYIIDAKEHIGYGIAYRDKEQQISFEDISSEPEKLSSIVEICNNIELSPLHLCDIVNDFLADMI